MSSYNDPDFLTRLVGRTVKGIYMSEDRLTFDTDAGYINYTVDGDCCSYSYFFDFYGVRHLLDNGAITAAVEHDLSPGDPGYVKDNQAEPTARNPNPDVVQVYGYKFTTDHPVFGPVTSVMSFRNDSNGYYGGDMDYSGDDAPKEDQERLTADKIG